MSRFTSFVTFALASTAATFVLAGQSDGKLPMYPNGHNMNEMPATAVASGVPLVLETADSVDTVDMWYQANAPQDCRRSTAAQGIKYHCDGGDIMIYFKSKTQIALIPAFPNR